GRAFHQRSGDRQAHRVGSGDVDRPPGRADPRRHGVFEGNADRALLPRRDAHRNLRRHERDPAPRDRPPRNRSSLSTHPEMSTRPKSIKAAPKKAAAPAKSSTKAMTHPIASSPARFDLTPVLEALRKRVGKSRAAQA